MNAIINKTNTRSIFAGMMMGLILVVGHVGAALAQPPSYPNGFLQRLIQIKYGTELYLSYQVKTGAGRTQHAIDTAFATYNTIRWQVDGLVYQISTEMIVRNSPALLRRLDTWNYGREKLAVKSSIQKHVANLEAIEQIYQELIEPVIYQNKNRTLNLTTNVFYLLKDSYTIVKGLSDLKTRKVMALVELLDHVRLMGPGELVKMGK